MLKFIVLFFAAFAVFSPLFLIGIRKYTAFLCHKDLSYLLTLFRPDRNILKVGIRGAYPSCGGYGLIESAVYPSVLSYIGLKSHRIGGVKLHERSVS